MDNKKKKEALIKKLLETNDESIIAAVKKIFKTEKKDWWDELTPEQKEEIEEGERQIDNGEFILYEDMMKKLR